MKIIKTFLFFMCAVVITPAQATTIYSQTWDGGTNNGIFSTYDTTPQCPPDNDCSWEEVSRVFDSFTLNPAVISSPASVNNVSWWGGFSNGFSPASLLFNVQILAGNDGSILSETNGAASQNAVDANGNFMYSMNLAAAYELIAGTPYYLSIQARFPMTDVIDESSWFWGRAANSGSGDRFSYYDNWLYENQSTNPPSNRFYVNGDFAFALNNVPEPATIWLVVIALAGMAMVRGRFTTRDLPA